MTVIWHSVKYPFFTGKFFRAVHRSHEVARQSNSSGDDDRCPFALPYKVSVAAHINAEGDSFTHTCTECLWIILLESLQTSLSPYSATLFI